jgi:hypothetical protein
MSVWSSRVLGITGLIALAGTIAGCTAQLTVKTKTRFVEPNVVKEDAADWDGVQPITINIQGVGASVNGGVFVTSDPAATKVKATARMLAMANDDDKASADLSIVDAKNSFTIANSAGASGGITVSCGHGAAHGSSNAGESGCERVDIVVPAGSDAKPLTLTVLAGSGDLSLNLANATIKNLGANANGADTTANLPATKGGSISLVSESSDINCTMSPPTWAADEVIAQADAASLSIPSDVKNGAGAGGRGTAGTGLVSLKLTAKSFAGSTGKITLR